MAKSAYQKAGVDIDEADRFTAAISKLVKPTLNSKVFKSIGGYAGLYQISKDLYIAATTDGVGTKLKLAIDLGIHKTVGIDLVAMSVNDLICVGATPLFFLDYLATGKLNLKTSKEIIEGIVNGCMQSKMALIGGETAEMPGMYHGKDYYLAGFAVGIVTKKDLIDGSKLKAGDRLIGLGSSGVHSNGYSLVRKLIKPSEKKSYLNPTKIYVKAMTALKGKVKAAAHITGSGFLNLPRMSSKFNYHLDLTKPFKSYNQFKPLIERAGMDLKEAYTTFNMGVGLVVAVSPHDEAKVLKILAREKFEAKSIGTVVSKTQKGLPEVQIKNQKQRIRIS